MASSSSSYSFSHLDLTFLFFLLPSTFLSPLMALLVLLLCALWFYPGGLAWAVSRAYKSIPGPPGVVLALSGPCAHRALASLARSAQAIPLMAFSVGLTRFVVSCEPNTAREILNSSAFADRPVKESAYELLFHRAMGFAPFGEYWRNLRRVSATHLFGPRGISASAPHRRLIGDRMLGDVETLMRRDGSVEIKRVLHFASLNSLMASVFGKTFDFAKGEGAELEGMVREGYELLGLFNWSDHFPILGWFDLQGVRRRCRSLVKRVNVFVGEIIEEHRMRRRRMMMSTGGGGVMGDVVGDFVDVLLDLEKEAKLSDADIVAVLWAEIDAAVGDRAVSEADIPNLPYLQAVVKETLRMHPPGPLLSWARLAVHDAHVGEHLVPAGTTAMVNMWAIAHDASIWPQPDDFRPDRFVGDDDVSVLGSDLRLAPFGAGRRVCPGKAMGLATVHLWLAQLLQRFDWLPSEHHGVDLSECLKMSLEMKNPLVCKAVPRSSASNY
ncbi:Cytochrome P450 78A5 [Ananas comosus]|uniref:Cytochrome P450 78A5 n=1 Tax=Ananas comosus TaxID=4615 RepID=A0A199W4J1_ANACO|nr:Cytochrome P450 78A5 [Ananas comosus]